MKGHSQITYDRRILFMASQSQAQEIREAAEDSGLSVSAFLRHLVVPQVRQKKAKENVAA